jgi:AmiR/NasT family two-component response regulator
MVMAQLGTDGTSAFAVLRARAFQEGRTLQEVAHDVLDRRTRLDGQEA